MSRTTRYCASWYYWGAHAGRDQKPWFKPDKRFKKLKRRRERAQVRNAMAAGKDIPVFPKTDVWEYT